MSRHYHHSNPGSSSSSQKRPHRGNGYHEAPPSKRSYRSERDEKKSKEESEEEGTLVVFSDVMRVSRVYEHDEMRLILQEDNDSPLVLAKAKYQCARDIKFGDRISVHAKVLKMDETTRVVSEIFIVKVLRRHRNGARRRISKHLINALPYCLEPKFIHELSENKEIKKTVLQVNILDMKLEIYHGCEKCYHLLPTPDHDDMRQCRFCKKRRARSEEMLYSRMRVSDFSGQIFVNVKTKTMEKLLEMYGYEGGIDQWVQFKEPKERSNWVFQALMIEVEKDSSNEWECTDIAEVNWVTYDEYLKQKEERAQRRLERTLVKK